MQIFKLKLLLVSVVFPGKLRWKQRRAICLLRSLLHPQSPSHLQTCSNKTFHYQTTNHQNYLKRNWGILLTIFSNIFDNCIVWQSHHLFVETCLTFNSEIEIFRVFPIIATPPPPEHSGHLTYSPSPHHGNYTILGVKFCVCVCVGGGGIMGNTQSFC